MVLFGAASGIVEDAAGVRLKLICHAHAAGERAACGDLKGRENVGWEKGRTHVLVRMFWWKKGAGVVMESDAGC